MARKSPRVKAARKPVAKAPVRKKPARRTTKAAQPKTVVRRKTAAAVTKQTPAKQPATKKPAAKKPAAGKSLGRPLVTAEEKLYMLFHEDYHARQIFEFLKVETVGELEHFTPQEIIRILSAPVRETVERIRRKLAENKRSLSEDKAYAREFLEARSKQGIRIRNTESRNPKT